MRLTTTRIIGIAVLLLSLFFYFTNPSTGVYLLAAIALVLLFAPEKYGESQLKKLTDSLNFKELSIITLFDVLFWFVFFVSATLINSTLEKIAKSFLGGINPQTIQYSTDVAKLSAATNSIKTFFLVLGLTLFGFVIINLLAYTLSRSLIWLNLLKKKFNLNSFIKFLGFNSLWWVLWAVIFVLLVLKRDPEVMPWLALTLAAFYIHTSTIAHYYLAKTNRIKDSFAKGFTISFGKLHLFILPYSFILLAYFILSKVITYIPLGTFEAVVNFIVLIAIMNIGRAYLKNVLDDV